MMQICGLTPDGGCIGHAVELVAIAVFNDPVQPFERLGLQRFFKGDSTAITSNPCDSAQRFDPLNLDENCRTDFRRFGQSQSTAGS